MIYILLLILLTSCSSPNIKEGDIIFHTSQSSQSSLIQQATNSEITHCGVIIIKNKQPYVLETLNTVTLTPISKFINRGKNKKYYIKRVIEDSILIEYDQYLNIPYDLSFNLNNDKLYCSELVYDIYKNQFNIELCDTSVISDYNISNLTDILDKRNIKHNTPVITPVDLFNSELLRTVIKT